MGEGYSKTAVAGHLGVTRQTIHNWCKTHPEFFDAIKRGEAGRTFKLERDLLTAKDGPTVTSRIFALKNAAPEEWKDKHQAEITGKDGGPIETTSIQAAALEAMQRKHSDAE